MFLNKQYMYLRQINPQQIQFLLHRLPPKEKAQGHHWTRESLLRTFPCSGQCPGGQQETGVLTVPLPYPNQMPGRAAFGCRLRGLKQKLRLYPESSKKYKPRRPWLSMGKVCLYEAKTTTYLLRLSIVCTWESKGKDR